MNAQMTLRRKFGITSSEALILIEMAQGSLLSRAEIRERCFKTKHVCSAAVPTHIYRINKAIAPLKISNVRAKGYRLEGESLTAIQNIMGGG